MKNSLCLWQCGRRIRNRTGICDHCWKDRESIYLARKTREAAARKPMSEAKKVALDRARAAKLLKHLPATELF